MRARKRKRPTVQSHLGHDRDGQAPRQLKSSTRSPSWQPLGRAAALWRECKGMSGVFQYIETYPGSLREFWMLVGRVYGLYRSNRIPAGGELLELDPHPSQYCARTSRPRTDIKILSRTPDETREAWRHKRPERISTTAFSGKLKRAERRDLSWIREKATGDATRRPEEQLAGVWQGCRVRVRLPSGELKRDTSAWIGASPLPVRETKVEFLDGCRSRDDTDAAPIGQIFQEFVRNVVRQWAEDPLPDWLSPKKEMPPASGNVTARLGGRPPLERHELVYRLAKAQEAEEIRAREPEKTWKEIAQQIRWRHGAGITGVERLRDARKRLKRLLDDDPDGILNEVAELRKAR